MVSCEDVCVHADILHLCGGDPRGQRRGCHGNDVWPDRSSVTGHCFRCDIQSVLAADGLHLINASYGDHVLNIKRQQQHMQELESN